MSENNAIPESPVPDPRVSRLLREAAEKRAKGIGWKAIAESLGRSVTAWNHWLTKYPEIWDRLLRSAEGRVFREAGAEALGVLRLLLRSEDEKIRRDVGRTLATLMYRIPVDRMPEIPSADDDLAELVQHVESLTDEQVAALSSLPADGAETVPTPSGDKTIVDASTS
jgi:hypothetical protein